jgi:hypothetical protein
VVRTAFGPADAALQRFLHYNYTMTPPTPIPSALLMEGQQYTIQATLCNFLGACASSTKTVTVTPSDKLVPIVSILGPVSRSVLRKNSLSLTSDAFTQACTGVKSYIGLTYSWTVAASGPGDLVAVPVDTLRSVSQSPAVFRLPGYSLVVGTEYTVTLVAVAGTSGQSGTATAKINVESAGLSAVISGGSRQYAQVADTITLDASGSSDLDYPERTGPTTGLLFSWKCVQTAPSFTTECPLSFTGGAYGQSIATVGFEALLTTSLGAGGGAGSQRARSQTGHPQQPGVAAAD